MRIFLVAFITYASQGANAFSFSSLASQKTQKPTIFERNGRRQRDIALSNDKLLAEPVDPKEDVELFGSTLGNDQVIADEILESISMTKPEDVVSEIAVDISEHVKSIFAETEPDVSETGEKPTKNALSGVEFADFGDAPMNEDVKAILEASSEAVAAAEASMPQDLKEQLEFPTTNSNTTTVAVQLEVDEIPEILSASSVVGEPVTTTKVESPRVSEILKFAIPAIGVWLCGPLLSLIDTSAVGVLSGTIQQAALNPAVAVTDYAALLIAFMYTGTTNLVAAAQEKDRGTTDKPITTKTMIGAMKLSSYVGAGLGAFLFAFARPLLKAIIGNDSISPAVFAAAMKYVRIRALGMPAAAIIGSAQSACLGMKDIRSPLYILVAAAVVNFFGDVFFVGNTHALIGGAAGAAWATVISQYAGVALFVRWLCFRPEKKPRVVNVSNAILELTGKPSSAGSSRRRQLRDALQTFTVKTVQKNKLKIGRLGSLLSRKKTQLNVSGPKNDVISVRGFLRNKFSFSELVKPPSRETREEFAPYLVPVTTTQVGRVSGYVAMSHVVASSLGTVSMAAQQVIVSLFYCLCPIADSLSLTAQSFVPSIFEKQASVERAAALRKTAMNFIKAGLVFGGAMMGAVSTIPLFTGFLTSDPAVVGMVNSVVPLLLAFFGLHGVMCGSEGLLLGQKDLSFLGKMYGAFFGVVPYLMLRVKRAALRGSPAIGLNSVWEVFLGYQIFRFAAWLARLGILQRRSEADARESSFSP